MELYKAVEDENTSETRNPHGDKNLHGDKDQRADSWRCCCGEFTNEHVKYMVQIGFGGAVMLFSMVQIIRNEGDTTVYYSMLSGTMGLFLPSPAPRTR